MLFCIVIVSVMFWCRGKGQQFSAALRLLRGASLLLDCLVRSGGRACARGACGALAGLPPRRRSAGARGPRPPAPSPPKATARAPRTPPAAPGSAPRAPRGARARLRTRSHRTRSQREAGPLAHARSRPDATAGARLSPGARPTRLEPGAARRARARPRRARCVGGAGPLPRAALGRVLDRVDSQRAFPRPRSCSRPAPRPPPLCWPPPHPSVAHPCQNAATHPQRGAMPRWGGPEPERAGAWARVAALAGRAGPDEEEREAARLAEGCFMGLPA